jgi:hypothetical protein
MAENHMGLQANRMLDREAGEEYKANKTNIVEVKQYGW